MSAEDKRREERWQAESDLRTLQEAEEIRGDKKRFERAKRYAKEAVNVFKS